MGMCIDMKVGESVLATARHGDFYVKVTVEKKSGGGVRLVVTAPPSVVLVPPNKQ